jgi:hypothetical protein
VNVHVASRERLSGGDVEVADYLVNTDAALKTASLLSLCIEVLGIMFALALLDALSTAKGPGYRCVCLADFITRVAAARLDCVGRCRCAEAFSAVSGVEMLRFVFVSDE